MILAGDIGGTNSRLGFFNVSKGRVEPVQISIFPSRSHANLEEIVREFIKQYSFDPKAACFGIAGPISKGRSEAINLAWTVDSAKLAKELKLTEVKLLNDLEANAWGIAALGPDDLLELSAGDPGSVGNMAVIAAGTGLGEAGLYWDGAHHWPFPSEGGHTDFGPSDELEAEMYLWAHAKFGHVSWERIVSGQGLRNIYEFLLDSGRAGSEKAPRDFGSQDPAAAITAAAVNGTSPVSIKALDLFVKLYGSEAGNLALKVMALGGVYLGGGIAPRIAARLKTGTFMEAFLNKGRVRPLLEQVPVHVILNDKAALFGAARCAAAGASLL